MLSQKVQLKSKKFNKLNLTIQLPKNVNSKTYINKNEFTTAKEYKSNLLKISRSSRLSREKNNLKETSFSFHNTNDFNFKIATDSTPKSTNFNNTDSKMKFEDNVTNNTNTYTNKSKNDVAFSNPYINYKKRLSSVAANTFREKKIDFYKNMFSKQEILLHNKDEYDINKPITYTSNFGPEDADKQKNNIRQQNLNNNIGSSSYRNANEILIKKGKPNVCYFREILGNTNTENNRIYNNAINMKVEKSKSRNIFNKKFTFINRKENQPANVELAFSKNSDQINLPKFDLNRIQVTNSMFSGKPKGLKALTASFYKPICNTIDAIDNSTDNLHKTLYTQPSYYSKKLKKIQNKRTIDSEKYKTTAATHFSAHNGKRVSNNFAHHQSNENISNYDTNLDPFEDRLYTVEDYYKKIEPLLGTNNFLIVKQKSRKEKYMKNTDHYIVDNLINLKDEKNLTKEEINLPETNKLKILFRDKAKTIFEKGYSSQYNNNQNNIYHSHIDNDFFHLINSRRSNSSNLLDVSTQDKDNEIISNNEIENIIEIKPKLFLESNLSQSKYITKHIEMPKNSNMFAYKIKQHINNKNNGCLNSFPAKNKIISDYEKDLIHKIKLIDTFLDNQKKENFKSQKQKYKKMFVIIDGTTVIKSLNHFGKFIDFPTKKILLECTTKKDRMKIFYEFLALVTELFNTGKKFTNIFALNGNPILDLTEIPENNRAIFVSYSDAFRGLHLIYREKLELYSVEKDTIEETEKRLFELHRSIEKIKTSKKLRNKKKSHKKTIFIRNKLNEHSNYKFYNPRFKNKFLFSNNSFDNEYTTNLENFDYEYYSDNETRKKDRKLMLELNFYDKNNIIPYFEEFSIKKKRTDIKNKYIDIINRHHKKRQTKGKIINLLDKYNYERAKKHKINIKKHEKDKAEIHPTTRIMIGLIERLKIFRFNNTDDIDELALDNGDNLTEKHFNKNKKLVESLYFQINYNVDKFYPDLISFNIPKILNAYPKIRRKELYEIFVQYKMLIKICIALNRSMKILKQGIDFETYFNAVPQMKSQGLDLAKKIFETINERRNNYLTWEEYLKGMLTFKSKEISDKIDMFFQIIDTDGNGLLSYEEVYDLSVASLQKGMESTGPNEVVEELAEYFANLIFQLVDIPKGAEIPLQKIKDKIILRGEEAAYLEMFINADTNTNDAVIKIS